MLLLFKLMHWVVTSLLSGVRFESGSSLGFFLMLCQEAASCHVGRLSFSPFVAQIVRQFMPPISGGGIMFSGCPSVCPSACLSKILVSAVSQERVVECF